MGRLGLKTLTWSLTGLVLSAMAAVSSAVELNSIGSAGIDAFRLHSAPYNLTGRKIAIGQVEIGRPGQFGIDKAVSKTQSISLMRVFYRNSRPRINVDVDGHAQYVASIMIGDDKRMQGVAPGARLYSSAAGTPHNYGQPQECLSAQHIAMQNGGDVRAINFSFGESLQQDPRTNAVLDGNALLTQCIDWSTRFHNVLYVVAGNQGSGGISIPTDNFNGINVSFTKQVAGVFRRIDLANLGDGVSKGRESDGFETNVGPRRAIGMTAPGDDIAVLSLKGNLSRATGTSFAAPHVTATVALLQEWGDRQLRVSCTGTSGCALPWTLDARRHEVMKAVLLNSADKLEDQGDGLLLGMTRTIQGKDNHTWLQSDAYRDRAIPLDRQMGTGQLNAFRAYQQFSPGQWSATAPIPAIGWDYQAVGLNPAPLASNVTSTLYPPSSQDYLLDQPLQKGSFIAATLVWDRQVDLVDRDGDGEYDLNESFRDRGLNNLDLHLIQTSPNGVQQSVVWSSESQVDSVEHIFYQIPETGYYKLRVQFKQQINTPRQAYALAWWTVPTLR